MFHLYHNEHKQFEALCFTLTIIIFFFFFFCGRAIHYKIAMKETTSVQT